MNSAASGDESPATRQDRSKLLSATAPPVMAALFALLYLLTIGWPAWPVRDASSRIAYSAIAAAFVCALLGFARSTTVQAVVGALAAAICVVPTMLPMVRPTDWGWGGLVSRATGVAVATAMTAFVIKRLADRDRSVLLLLVQLGMTAAMAGLLVLTGSMRLGQAGLCLSACAAAAALLGLFVRDLRASAAVIGLCMAVLAGLTVSGRLWSDLPWIAIVAVFAAPLLASVVRLPMLTRWPAWRRVAVGLLIAAAPATAVVAVEAVKKYQAYQSESSDSASDYGL